MSSVWVGMFVLLCHSTHRRQADLSSLGANWGKSWQLQRRSLGVRYDIDRIIQFCSDGRLNGQGQSDEKKRVEVGETHHVGRIQRVQDELRSWILRFWLEGL